MSTASHPFQPPHSAHNTRRHVSNTVTIVLATAFAAFAVLVLVYLLVYVVRQGIPYLNANFFTKLPTPNGEPGGGMAESIQGTLILVGLAA
ncbi:MAG: phosphate ABC transporter, permease protein PstA, partial [Ktedonobacteraceae bacterium]